MYINYSDLCPAPMSDFLEYMLSIKGRSPKTVSEYYLDLRTFYRFLVIRFRLSSTTENFEEIDINLINLHILNR